MIEQRFRDLEKALRRHGVAAQHARRAVIEMAAHHQQLIEDAIAKGNALPEAHRGADAAFGSDREIIERFDSRRELKCWSHRWPAGYILAPVLSFLVIGVADMAGLIGLIGQVARHLPRTYLPPAVASDITPLLSAFLLWALPVSVATAFGLLAFRRGLALRWPLAGTLLLCVFSALVNVSCVITAHWRGVASVGIGIREGELLRYLFHAGAMTALVLIPLALLAFRSRSDRLTNG